MVLRDCRRCNLHVAAKQLYAINCESLDVNMFCLIGPTLQSSSKCVFGVFDVSFPHAFELWTRARLYPFEKSSVRKFADVHDESGNEKETTPAGKRYAVKMKRGANLDVAKVLGQTFAAGTVSSNPVFDIFPVGQPVEARYKGKKHWFPGKISATPCRFGSRYDVVYADGDKESSVSASLIRVPTPTETSSFTSHQRVHSWIVDRPTDVIWSKHLDHAVGTKMFGAIIVSRDAMAFEIGLRSEDSEKFRFASMLRLSPVTTSGQTYVQLTFDFELGTPSKYATEKAIAVREKIVV